MHRSTTIGTTPPGFAEVVRRSETQGVPLQFCGRNDSVELVRSEQGKQSDLPDRSKRDFCRVPLALFSIPWEAERMRLGKISRVSIQPPIRWRALDAYAQAMQGLEDYIPPKAMSYAGSRAFAIGLAE